MPEPDRELPPNPSFPQQQKAGEAEGLAPSLREAFASAFRAGDADSVSALFRKHPAARAAIDAPVCAFDSPPLVHFAGAGNLAMVNVLLEFGADPNRRSQWWAGGFHALHSAEGEVAERLVEAGAVVDACAAAHLDRADLLAAILHEDPTRVHERGGDGQTPLHFARSREVVDLLLRAGADIDARDVDHRGSPAEWMLERRRGAGRYDLAAYLVERGASSDVFLAAALGLEDRLRAMLEERPSLATLRTGRGAYAEQAPSSFHIYTWTLGQNLSPLQVAAQFAQDTALEVLRDLAGPEERFLAACVTGDEPEASRLLAEHSGLLAELAPDRLRALPDAAWVGNAAGVDLMLSLGFPASTPGQDGGTALHCAAWQGAAACVEAALRHDGVRAGIAERDPTHDATPLGWCCHGATYCANPAGDYPRVARLLLEAGAPLEDPEDAPEEVASVIRSHRG